MHVHVYKVVGKLEYDIDEVDPVKVKEKALSMAIKVEEFEESDCKLIALIPK